MSNVRLELNTKVRLVVGGRKFTVYHKTLQNVPNTPLAMLTKSHHSYDHEEGAFYFDRSARLFEPILNFYRTGELHFPHCLCGPSIKTELEFWGIDESCVSACCWNAYKESYMEEHTLIDLKKLNDDGEMAICEQTSCNMAFINSKTREKIWTFLDKPTSSPGAKIWSIFFYFLIVISISTVALETHPLFRVPKESKVNTNTTNAKILMYYETDTASFLRILEQFCCVVFIIELATRFIVCPSKLNFMKSWLNIIDILSITPLASFYAFELYNNEFWLDKNFIVIITYLSFTSTLRVFRLFKIARHYRSMKLLFLAVRSSFREILLLFWLILMGMFIFSTVIYFAEFQIDDTFDSIPLGFWWSITTMTAVGYGDMIPTSLNGYIVGSMCAISGMLIIGLPIPIVAANLKHFNHLQELSDLLDKRRELACTTKWKGEEESDTNIALNLNGTSHSSNINKSRKNSIYPSTNRQKSLLSRLSAANAVKPVDKNANDGNKDNHMHLCVPNAATTDDRLSHSASSNDSIETTVQIQDL